MLAPNQVVDRYYLETRCMLIEIAATLDRYDRAQAATSNGRTKSDDRWAKIRESLKFLASEDSGSNRSESLLRMFSEDV